MDDPKFKLVELDSLKFEDGAKELMSTPEMQPYLRYLEAAMFGGDVAPPLREIADLPLEKRYVWRVVSALKWGFADSEDWNVIADRKTLRPEDFAKVMQLLRSRPIQFCMFLRAFVGAEEMERVMNHAIAVSQTGRVTKPMPSRSSAGLRPALKGHGDPETVCARNVRLP